MRLVGRKYQHKYQRKTFNATIEKLSQYVNSTVPYTINHVCFFFFWQIQVLTSKRHLGYVYRSVDNFAMSTGEFLEWKIAIKRIVSRNELYPHAEELGEYKNLQPHTICIGKYLNLNLIFVFCIWIVDFNWHKIIVEFCPVFGKFLDFISWQEYI